MIGGGGAVGAASCCGALRALSDVAGIDVNDARVLIGTSAGGAIAADLRLGRTIDEIVTTMHTDEAGLGSLSAAWKSRPELVRRAVGSSWIMAQSAFPGTWPVARPWRLVQRAFPGSLISIAQERWSARYPAEWPERQLWLVASDLDSGGRVVLTGDHHEGAHVPLTKAVQATCAVPGMYAPVRIGSRRLIDGGVQSATNLDVAVRTGCRAVIALAPMGYDRREPPGYLRAVGRLKSNTKLDQEVTTVRRAGMAVLTVRPGAEELRHHRFNIMSREGHERVMEAAYETTSRRLADGAGRRALDQIIADALRC